MLEPDEIRRYKRHLLLKEIGGQGQQKLKASRVLAVGAGGLGSPLLLYLAAAGVGHIGVIDHDHVSLDNLQRQIVHATANVGSLKTDSAAEALKRLNPHVETELMPVRIDAGNALDILGRYDLVADGSDNFATRYLVNDARILRERCFAARRSTAIFPRSAPSSATRGQPETVLPLFFPEPPPGTVPSCQEAGILGAVAGVMGTLMAVEVVKELLGIGQSLTGRLLIYDALAARFETITVAWDRDNPLTGLEPSILDLSVHQRQAPA
jgi:adenylyltransferase/sulfurtransferase